MSETPRSSNGNHADAPGPNNSRPPALLLVAAMLFLEAAALAAITVWLVVELLTATAQSLASALALIGLSAIATAFVAAIGIGALRRQAWIRGAAMTWQVVQIAVAVGAFQGAYSRPDVGWLILVPSLVVIVLLFTPAVSAALRRE